MCIRDRYSIIGALIFFSESKTCASSYLCTYNSVTAKKFDIHAEKVHASPLSFCRASRFAVQFSHTGICTNAFSQGQSMITVTGDEWIIGPRSRHTTRRNSLLADISMEKTTDFPIHFI